MLEFLFVGAHPDDIEIGAGATVGKFISLKHKVSALILTDERNPNIRKLRRQEAINAISRLGVPRSRILFAGLADGKKKVVDNKAVTAIRQLTLGSGVTPDVVVTHTRNDDHNDHRYAYDLMRTAFRERVLLSYPVVNSLTDSAFAPRFFVDTSKYREMKVGALKQHKTQVNENRIKWSLLDNFDKEAGAKIATDYAEGFEVDTQFGSADRLKELQRLNDSPFHTLWLNLIGDRSLYYIHSEPINRKTRQYNWLPNRDRVGAELLRAAFYNQWFGIFKFEENSCSSPVVEDILENNDILLGGGAVNNLVTRNYFNHFPGVNYVIDYDMPDYKNIRIFDRKRNRALKAEYRFSKSKGDSLAKDTGILSIMKNPLTKDRHLIGCMGIHGPGAYGCYKALTQKEQLKALLKLFDLPLPANTRGYQVLIDFDCQSDEIKILNSTLHTISGDL
jgi:LmbE family N-acetylglucosaminyl deacetylase